MDKTSTRKGHNYVTLAVDLDESRVVHVSKGKGKATLQEIKRHLDKKGAPEKQANQISAWIYRLP